MRRRSGISKQIFELPIATPDGDFVAHYSGDGLCGLDFPSDREAQKNPSEAPAPIRQWHQVASAALEACLAGRPAEKLPPLDLSAGTAFQQRVWHTLLRIGPGETRSYGEVAAAIGSAKAVRAVGGACGANPIPVLVPCHRVLAANHKLGGFSSGLDWKRKLLGREGTAYGERIR